MPSIRIESKIDSGGFGEVYRAVIVDSGENVAIKKLARPYSLEDAKRFNREVRIMESMNHPNIVKVLFTKLDSDPPSFVMPLADFNLEKILPDLRQDEDRRRIIFSQILDGLKYAHEHEPGVIHRDIKPQNILIMKGDIVLISDFGLGKFITRDTTTLTIKGEKLGTILYASPEQIEDFCQADERSDIYALGKILFQMLSSRPIFPVPDLTGLDGKYVFIIQKCISPNPEERYQTVSDLYNDFQLLTQEEIALESPPELIKTIIGELVNPFIIEDDIGKIEKLVKLFLDNTDDTDIFLNILPRIPNEILKKIIKNQKIAFINIFQVFDEMISGSLEFSYCDVVADFYKEVFRDVDEFRVKRIVLIRLLNMGFSHNRWYVRDVLAILINEITDIGLARLALEVFQRNPKATQWSSIALDIDKVHPLLRDGINEINNQIDKDDFEIPF